MQAKENTEAAYNDQIEQRAILKHQYYSIRNSLALAILAT